MVESKNLQDLPPLELLKTYSSSRDFRESFWVILGLGPQPKFEVQGTPKTDRLIEPTGGRFPVRGFLYSCVLHQIVVILLITVVPLVPVQRKKFEFERWIPLDAKLTFPLPQLEPREKGGHEGGGKPGGKSGGGSAEKSAEAPAPAPKEGGLVYPAPIEAVSNPPNPDNRIQTILQPDLVDPPRLKAPIPLPNMVEIARGNPAPPPLVPKVDTSLPVPSTPAVPKLTLPPGIAKLLPKELKPAPPPLVPKVNIAASSAPPVEAPRLPVEARAPGMVAFEQGYKAAAPPPLVPSTSHADISAGRGAAPGLALPPGAGGSDDRNILVLSPTPGPPGSAGNLPRGAARGQFAMGPNANLRGIPGLPPGRSDGIDGGTGTGPGDSEGTGHGGTGTRGAGVGGTGPGEGGGGGGTGTGTGPGTGSGVGPGTGTGSGTGGRRNWQWDGHGHRKRPGPRCRQGFRVRHRFGIWLRIGQREEPL